MPTTLDTCCMGETEIVQVGYDFSGGRWYICYEVRCKSCGRVVGNYKMPK